MKRAGSRGLSGRTRLWTTIPSPKGRGLPNLASAASLVRKGEGMTSPESAYPSPHSPKLTYVRKGSWPSPFGRGDGRELVEEQCWAPPKQRHPSPVWGRANIAQRCWVGVTYIGTHLLLLAARCARVLLHSAPGKSEGWRAPGKHRAVVRIYWRRSSGARRGGFSSLWPGASVLSRLPGLLPTPCHQRSGHQRGTLSLERQTAVSRRPGQGSPSRMGSEPTRQAPHPAATRRHLSPRSAPHHDASRCALG
jgi:hypothetical protein